MFQNFSAPDYPVTGDSRLKALRNEMEKHSLDALIVPHADEQRNEYLPASAERLAWISGFTGSAGEAVITKEQAVVFVDGRYTLQSAQQTDANFWTVESLIENPAHKWLRQNLGSGAHIGFDPWLHTLNEVKNFKAAAKDIDGELIPLKNNLVDAVWKDRPAPPCEPVSIHDFTYAGKPTRKKLEAMQAAMVTNNADLCVLSDPSSVCWLFNIRGHDVAHTPITLAHAVLRSDDEPILFIDGRKLDIETKAFLTQVCELREENELSQTLSALADQARVMLDPNLAAFALHSIVEDAGGTVVSAADPARLPRAIKNEAEIKGTRSAHLRDGAAVTSFLAWLDQQASGSIDEITAAKKLEQYRTDMAGNMPLRDISFDTISGSGPNGAIVHYRVDENSNRTLQEGELYLCDSGAQHDDGTTDITRTIAVGEPSDEQRKMFTLVLKGHIGIALARFPKGTRGVDIDVLARMPLWQHGADYAHGTGHGVGSYLSVHEGPQNISKRGMQELLPGMIISNEPGYYRTGEFGIRIENLVLVREEMEIVGGDQPMLGFETLTLAPIDQRLIDTTLLTDGELHWLNAYHGHVRRELEPLVEERVANWLKSATEPMVQNLPPASA
jgi:Xaa-Pro aminopeptidase